MALRQYVGARYVIKIYENSLDPSQAEWEANVNYEPLTMVTYNYGSYLSKKEVPANIGDPASNPDYWTQTGFYNGQIAQLRSDVDALNAEMINVNGHLGFEYGASDDIICIGDSWAVGLHATHGLTYWLEQTLPYNNFYHAEENGSGFGIAGAGGNKFIDLLQGVTVSDPDDVKHIIVLGGLNDQNGSNVDTAIDAFMTYVNATYTNATVDVVIVDRMRFGTLARYHYITTYTNTFANYANARVIDITHKLGSSHWYNDSHLDEDGYKQCASIAIASLLGGDTACGYDVVEVTGTEDNNSFTMQVKEFNVNGNIAIYTYGFVQNNVNAPNTIKSLEFTLNKDITSNDLFTDHAMLYLTANGANYNVPALISTPARNKIKFTWFDDGTINTYDRIYYGGGDTLKIGFDY